MINYEKILKAFQLIIGKSRLILYEKKLVANNEDSVLKNKLLLIN
jgi:hypothetical protein